MKFSPLLVLFLLLCGCQSDPHVSDYTTTKPAVSQLAGAYLPTAETVAFIKSKGPLPAGMQIVLSADGSFRYHNLPQYWNQTSGDPHGKPDSSYGYWIVRKEQNEPFWDVIMGGAQISLFGDKQPYTLHIILGDPDTGEALDFEQQVPHAEP